jgi:hypothetical protein
VYALDAETGKLLWKTKVETSQVARITGSPTFYDGRLYVPMASSEEGAGTTPTYECCHFRGSVTALDASTGKIVWQTYTIPEVPFPTTKNKIGTQGRPARPSGAARIDPRRNALYITTGNNTATRRRKRAIRSWRRPENGQDAVEQADTSADACRRAFSDERTARNQRARLTSASPIL